MLLVKDWRTYDIYLWSKTFMNVVSALPMANTYVFFTKKWSKLEIHETNLWQWKICGVRNRRVLLKIDWYRTNIFLSNTAMDNRFWQHRRLTPTRFFMKKWCQPKIQDINLWHANLCGLTNMSLSSKINEHTINIFGRKRSWTSVYDNTKV